MLQYLSLMKKKNQVNFSKTFIFLSREYRSSSKIGYIYIGVKANKFHNFKDIRENPFIVWKNTF